MAADDESDDALLPAEIVDDDPDEDGDLDGEDDVAGGFQVPDLQGLLAQAQEMQAQLMAAQAQAAEQVFEGRAGGGVVTVAMTGGLVVQAVRIDPGVVDPAEVELLEDLVLAAFRDAVAQAHDAQTASLGGLGLGGGLGGLLGG